MKTQQIIKGVLHGQS